jgi:uncharacterized protein (DUF1778 family)
VEDLPQDSIQAAAAVTIRRVSNSPIPRAAPTNIRFTPAERDMLSRVARQLGRHRSAYIRDAVLDVTRHIIEAQGEEPEA